jgi:hypothetical protein
LTLLEYELVSYLDIAFNFGGAGEDLTRDGGNLLGCSRRGDAVGRLRKLGEDLSAPLFGDKGLRLRLRRRSWHVGH